VRAAADSFRPNPAFSTEEVITQMGVGEALVSVLEDKGIPSIVGRTLIRPPSGKVGPVSPDERRALIASSPVAGQYDHVIDRESAFEVLQRKTGAAQAQAEREKQAEMAQKQAEAQARVDRANVPPAPRRSTRASPMEAAMTSLARSAATSLGRALVRGILGSLTRGR
jgi:DNA helicase HerA-like ATPase